MSETNAAPFTSRRVNRFGPALPPRTFAGFAAEGPGVDVRGLVEQLHGAVRQVVRSGSAEQLTAAAEIISEARRALYLLLADGPTSSDRQDGTSQEL